MRSVFQKCRSNVRIGRNSGVNSAGATLRNNTVGTTASATSGNNIGITGAREVRDISTNTTASVQFVRAKLVGTAAGVQANRVNLVGTIAIPRFGNSNATARGRTHRTDAMATNRLGRRADVPSGHLGKVRARLEVGQARRLGGTVLGRRAIALGGPRILRRVAIVLNINVGRGQVAGAGQARSLGVTARTRLGRARKSATNLLGLEAAIRRGHGGEVDQDRRNIRLSAQVQGGHIGKVRVRLEHAQARRLSGTNQGRRAKVLSVHKGQVRLGLGQARSLGDNFADRSRD